MIRLRMHVPSSGFPLQVWRARIRLAWKYAFSGLKEFEWHWSQVGKSSVSFPSQRFDECQQDIMGYFALGVWCLGLEAAICNSHVMHHSLASAPRFISHVMHHSLASAPRFISNVMHHSLASAPRFISNVMHHSLASAPRFILYVMHHSLASAPRFISHVMHHSLAPAPGFISHVMLHSLAPALPSSRM